MKKVLLFITLLIGSVSFGQTISINGSLHSTNGDNTFPIWVEEGATIQPNYPVKSISIKEFNVVPNSNGNDLVFNKTILVYSDSVSSVPDGKTWKLESIQNELMIGDFALGGTIVNMNEDNSGIVLSNSYLTNMGVFEAISYCENSTLNGYDDWYLPSKDELISLKNSGYFNVNGDYWSSTNYNGNEYWVVIFNENSIGTDWTNTGNPLSAICIRQF